MDEKLLKKIKKNLYGHPQTVLAVFPAGLGSVALDECNAILQNLWFKQKYLSEVVLLKNAIRIDQIHLFEVTELLMRSLCLLDIRLIIWEGKAFGKSAFKNKCRESDWEFYLNQEMTVKIKVNSIASRAFHETGLKEILSEILDSYVDRIVSGEDAIADTTIHANLYKDKLSLSISLAGAALYKRGYRGVLSASAPLREDAAACCIQRALSFAKNLSADYKPNTLLVPFSGTGTFLFEYLLQHCHLSPVVFDRTYALQKMPLYRSENFNYLLKKAKENYQTFEVTSLQGFCIDSSEAAMASLLENQKIFNDALITKNYPPLDALFDGISLIDDFLKMDYSKLLAEESHLSDIFMPLNPPYGVRLGKNLDTDYFYKLIAKKINELKNKVPHSIAGFILCPQESAWSAFCNTLQGADTETFHFTQGGMDIRVCLFFISSLTLKPVIK